MRVLLVAEEAAGIQTLKRLAGSEHELVATMAAEPGDDARVASVAAVARQLGVPVWPAELVKDASLADRIREHRIDLLLNVHSLFLIHDDVLEAPTIGSFNLHPGPLPQYAGLNTPSWAIYFGERRHGVTVHWMVPAIDAGAIAYQALFDITPDDTGLSVSAKCVRHGLPLLDELISTAARDPAAIPAIEQHLGARRYFGRQVPHDGWMPWSLSARRLVDFVRASDYSPFASPWGVPRARIAGKEVAVVKASPTHEPCAGPPGVVGHALDHGVMVSTADEWVVLERTRVGGNPVDPRELLVEGSRFETGDEPIWNPRAAERAVSEGSND